MRIVFLNTDYPSFLAALYGSSPSLAGLGYDEQMTARNRSFFGTADFMSRHFRALGHEAIDIHANNRPLQEAWMREHGRVSWLSRLTGAASGKRFLQPMTFREPRFFEILEAQLRAFAPDVIYNHDPGGIAVEWLRDVSPRDCALVAQIASPRDPGTQWGRYDLVISSLPNFVAMFRRDGIATDYLPLCFEKSIWDELRGAPRDIPLSFVGSITKAHRERVAFLETIAKEREVAFWGDGVETLPAENPVRKSYRGPAWGRDMFALLGRSRLTINKHIDISEGYANNMRLFEAAGMGACLVTDWRENLADLFEPGRDVVAYRSSEECLSLLRYYSDHDDERCRIAEKGQERCLTDHTYERRMTELATLLARRFV